MNTNILLLNKKSLISCSHNLKFLTQLHIGRKIT